MGGGITIDFEEIIFCHPERNEVKRNEAEGSHRSVDEILQLRCCFVQDDKETKQKARQYLGPRMDRVLNGLVRKLLADGEETEVVVPATTDTVLHENTIPANDVQTRDVTNIFRITRLGAKSDD